MIKKIRNIGPWKYVILVIRLEEVIKRKASKLYVKQRGSGDSFNSWIDKKDVII